ncbi:glycosyltransferase family 9 protein [Halomonas alkalisoli]|uniref:glycosyltransferase family 9 protein n=1 Tax=Halomonas alkalisoli TaxID=2907158 RepID=UPI001F43B0AD|nr:glycosyltransferase family 9 protein [Halomonas alkalisoli]MCE9682598.1 glycosyltransferase family 9 protein [Halomonas alkalisoli]
MLTPDRLRRLDRWLGAPVAWLASAWLALRRRQARADDTTGRVLLLQLSESGSMVLADPAIRALARQQGELPLCVTLARNAPALAITGTLPPERVFALHVERFWQLPGEAWRLARWARRHQVRTVLDLELFSHGSALLGVLAGARRRVGFTAEGLRHGALYTRAVRYDQNVHMARNYLRLVATGLDLPAAWGEALPLTVPLRAGDPAVRARLGETLAARLPEGSLIGRRLVLINANASAWLPQRRWPLPAYAALVRALLARHPDLVVALIGAAEEHDTTTALAAAVANPRCLDFAGKVTLPELPALFSLASLMVSNDSGPAHFAAVSPLPVVVLFGPESPLRYRPLGNARTLSVGLACSPCVSATNQRRTRCTDNQCLQQIGVDAVLAAAEATLGPPKPSALYQVAHHAGQTGEQPAATMG